ncbi:hypothetical protein Gotri_015501 [Gossypium trilobum]|uniref:Uncharacterized protein n=1 Tax=Gossypium trilobum TaxID=34281 RepID=A0A7J9E0E9_9ROSI|nr:hypothetical protein [Gossypium trilobum]
MGIRLPEMMLHAKQTIRRWDHVLNTNTLIGHRVQLMSRKAILLFMSETKRRTRDWWSRYHT